MMTARHLVRRLLELRRLRSDQFALRIDEPADQSQSLRGYSQSGADADLGRVVLIDNVGPQGNGVVAVGQRADLNNSFAHDWHQPQGLGEQHINSINFDGLASQSNVFGHQSLPSQSLNTVSGFWVPFKRKPAPQPSQSEAAA